MSSLLSKKIHFSLSCRDMICRENKRKAAQELHPQDNAGSSFPPRRANGRSLSFQQFLSRSFSCGTVCYRPRSFEIFSLATFRNISSEIFFSSRSLMRK